MVRPGGTATACENPLGSGSDGGLISSDMPSDPGWGPRSPTGPLGRPLLPEGPMELGVVLAPHEQRLGRGLELDRAREIHVLLASQKELRGGERGRGALGQGAAQLHGLG